MPRKNNVQDMTITEQLECIKEDICDNYCKHPGELALYLEADEACQILMDDYCSKCPLKRL